MDPRSDYLITGYTEMDEDLGEHTVVRFDNVTLRQAKRLFLEVLGTQFGFDDEWILHVQWEHVFLGVISTVTNIRQKGERGRVKFVDERWDLYPDPIKPGRTLAKRRQ